MTTPRRWMPASGLKREALVLALFAAFGLGVLPFLVYAAGILTLGTYDGGLSAFLGSLYGAFFALRPGAWILLLGPYLLFWILRLLTRPLRRRNPAVDDQPRPA